MKKVLLVVPPQRKITDVKQLGSIWPRIGIAYIAAYLREQGAVVQILDCKAEQIDTKEAIRKISAFQPDLVGITAFTEEIHDAADICREIKSVNKDIKTVVGGAHASALPEYVLSEFKDIDIIVCGEGEHTLWDIVRTDGFSNLEVIDGIAFRSGDKIILNKPRALIKEIDDLPYPAWDLFPLDLYRGRTMISLGSTNDRRVLELPILSIRGCPYRCNFCFHVYGNTARFRDYIKVVDEIEHHMKCYGATDFFFADGTFGIRENNVIGLCDEIIRRGINNKIRWSAPTRADVLNEEVLSLMKQSGCLTCNIGIESGNEKILAASGKDETKKQIRNAVSAAKKVGLPVDATFIIGHPNETIESIRDTVDFAIELDVAIFNLAIMIPYPGTKIQQMAENGESNYRLLTRDWSKYTKQSGGPLELENIPLEKLRELQARAYLRFYFRLRKITYIIKTIPLLKIVSIGIDLLKNALLKPIAKILKRPS